MPYKEKELNREALLKKKYITEDELFNTLGYEYWCLRNYPLFLKKRHEDRILDEYLEFLKQGKLILLT